MPIFTDMLEERLNAKLVRAAANGNINTVKELLEDGADANAKTRDGRTALLMAIPGGHLNIVELLVKNGADVNKQGKDGSTAVMLSVQNLYLDILKFLVAHGAKVDVRALLWAADSGLLNYVEYLVEAGADVNARDPSGRTALLLTAMKGDLSIVKYLVAHGADQTMTDYNGITAAILARENGHENIAAYLDSLMQKDAKEINSDARGTVREASSKNQLKTEFSNVLRR
ncbi:MAG: ankyrin repeat domain-containing protein [Candidatus Micrarchaeales archaeon]|jgi:ankyrin repeat protein|uniref:Ankyrin repeat protein n=1 Tax=Candidatus Micrarchaeum acidiphilum ARMAN-2 TaxID=425595 RepID=C7DHI2_MICA2|nr:MAG: ankyrin repeat protein [Candidatus Micrarchaeum acidiphilum ARMAN-2]MCW6160653.1 ankyrin repeat domain-containing protein [Candidatus Micrarchaeales archaeon]